MAIVVPPQMLDRLKEIESRFNRIEEELGQPHIISDRKKFSELSKEHSTTIPMITAFKAFQKDHKDYIDSIQVLETERDADIVELAKAEIADLEPKVTKQIDELQVMLLPKDPRDEKNVVLEVRAGVGGDEAALFAYDLYRAYVRYAEGKGWKVEPLSISDGTAGGFKEVIAGISGERVFSQLKHESGVHRVQRVPKTEAQGRVHTSTVTVAVLPEAEDIELDINPADIRVDTFRAGGAGGQHVNKTDSAVRLTYLPTNEVVVCQDERSQHKNRDKAMKVLRTRLLEKMREEQRSKESSDRKSQVGGGFRNERIRTYNFPQGRVSDHRIGMTTYNLSDVMDGHIDDFISSLNNYYQMLQMRGEDAPGVVVVSDDD